jgi:hypothetical protein
MSSRQTYAREVERLLDEIRRDVDELRVLSVAGVRRAGLAERKTRLMDARDRLAHVVRERELAAVTR